MRPNFTLLEGESLHAAWFLQNGLRHRQVPTWKGGASDTPRLWAVQQYAALLGVISADDEQEAYEIAIDEIALDASTAVSSLESRERLSGIPSNSHHFPLRNTTVACVEDLEVVPLTAEHFPRFDLEVVVLSVHDGVTLHQSTRHFDPLR